jgi:hypothetical protein
MQDYIADDIVMICVKRMVRSGFIYIVIEDVSLTEIYKPITHNIACLATLHII